MYVLLNVKGGTQEGKRKKDAKKRWSNGLTKHNISILSVGQIFDFAFARTLQCCDT